MRNVVGTSVALVFAASIYLTSPDARADWTVCNRSNYDVWIAVAWESNGAGHVSQGWWRLQACDGCQKVLTGQPSALGVWLYAMDANSHVSVLQGDNMQFCVKDDKFKLELANSKREVCTTSGGRLEDFKMFKLSTSGDTVTKIKGFQKKHSAVCID